MPIYLSDLGVEHTPTVAGQVEEHGVTPVAQVEGLANLDVNVHVLSHSWVCELGMQLKPNGILSQPPPPVAPAVASAASEVSKVSSPG